VVEVVGMEVVVVRVVRVPQGVPLVSQRLMAKLSLSYRRLLLRHRIRRHRHRRSHRRSHTENVYWSYHACSWVTSVNPKFLIYSTNELIFHMVVERMVVVVVELEYMVELGQDRSSCSDVNRLVVVVGLVGMELLVVLVVLEVLAYLGLLGLLGVLGVHLVLALLVHLGVPSFLRVLGVLGLVEVVVVEEVEEGVEVVGVVDMARLDLLV